MTRTPDTDDELPFVDHEAPSGWQGCVWDRIEREDIRRHWLRAVLTVLACAAFGAALGVALLAIIIALGGWP